MENKPIVSILMNCYNGKKYLKEAIDSVFSQTYENWEIIFVDNCSTDNSAEIAKSYNDGRLKYYKTEENIPLYTARNFGLQYISGKYLAFLDVDDLWFDTKLEKQIAIMEQDKTVVMIHTNTIFFNSDKNISYVSNKNILPSGFIFREAILKYRISLETVLIRKDVIDKNQIYFSNSFNLIGDRDLITTVAYYGKTIYLNEVLGKWRIHSNNFSKKLTSQHPKELKYMYLRFKKRFKKDFTKDLRKCIHEEIILREAINLLDESGYEVRKKLSQINIFRMKSLFIYVISFLPSTLALNIIKKLRN